MGEMVQLVKPLSMLPYTLGQMIGVYVVFLFFGCGSFCCGDHAVVGAHTESACRDMWFAGVFVDRSFYRVP